MKRLTLAFLLVCFHSRFVFSSSIVGVWESDCQNVGENAEGYLSQRPVDTFEVNQTASLRIHVFEGRNCRGREWDLMTIPCHYLLGQPIANLAETSELDLTCEFEGKEVTWYEIAEVKSQTLRYGNQTGETPETRPKELGSVVYRKK